MDANFFINKPINSTSPFPPKEMAPDLKGLREAIKKFPESVDISVTWVEHASPRKSCYFIHPVKGHICSIAPLQSPDVAAATKQAIHHEIRRAIVKLTDSTHRHSSHAGYTSSETLNELKLYNERMNTARRENPYVPVNREFLENIFDSKTDDANKQSSKQKEGLVNLEGTVISQPPPKKKLTQEEVAKIIELLDFVQKELTEEELTFPKPGKDPSFYLRKRFEELVDGKNTALTPQAKKMSEELSSEIKEFIRDIRKQQPNCIDDFFKDSDKASKEELFKRLSE